MNIGVLREILAVEARVALMPDSVQKLVANQSNMYVWCSFGF
jgi:alanine dehydrogenase